MKEIRKAVLVSDVQKCQAMTRGFCIFWYIELCKLLTHKDTNSCPAFLNKVIYVLGYTYEEPF